MKPLLAALALAATSAVAGGPQPDPPTPPLLTQPPSATLEAPSERPLTTIGRDVTGPLGDARLSPIPSEYRVDVRGGLRVAYHPTLHDAAGRALRALEDSRARLSSRVGQRVLERVELRLGRTPEELVALAPRTSPPAPGADVAVYASARVIALSAQPGASGDELDARVRHAAAHVALLDAVDGRPLPRWLDEGFAIESAGDRRVARALTLVRAQLDGGTMPLAQLESFADEPGNVALADAEVADFVRSLSSGDGRGDGRDDGRARFTALLGRLRAGEPFAQALSITYDADLATLEARWRDGLSRRYLLLPATYGALTLIGVAGGAFLALRLRRRRREAALARADRLTAEALAALVPDAPRGKPPKLIVVDEGRGHVVYLVSSRPVPKITHDGKTHTLH